MQFPLLCSSRKSDRSVEDGSACLRRHRGRQARERWDDRCTVSEHVSQSRAGGRAKKAVVRFARDRPTRQAGSLTGVFVHVYGRHGVLARSAVRAVDLEQAASAKDEPSELAAGPYCGRIGRGVELAAEVAARRGRAAAKYRPRVFRCPAGAGRHSGAQSIRGTAAWRALWPPPCPGAR